MNAGVTGADTTDALLAHPDGRLRIVHQVAGQPGDIGDHFGQLCRVPISRHEVAETG